MHALQPCKDPCIQPILGVHLACLVGTDRGHQWGGVLLGAHCCMSRELSRRLCPASSVQGLFFQGPAGYHHGHYLHSPPLCPGLWCPLEEPHTHLRRVPSGLESDPIPTPRPHFQGLLTHPGLAQSNVLPPQRTQPGSLGAALGVRAISATPRSLVVALGW